MRLEEALPRLPEREADTHKGSYGKLLLLAGSANMSGAAILAARAAYRAGAGLVAVGIERALFPAVTGAVPEAIFLDAGAWREQLTGTELNAYSAVVIGPGLGQSPAARDLVRWVLGSRDGPLVVDADALNLLAAESGITLASRPDRIWTPHPGEFARLIGEKPRGDDERIEAARRFVEARGGVLVLKGHNTVVMDRERYAVNQTGNPGMATAGSGDVLAGIIAAFLGQGLEPFAAARLAVHLHGLAGDLAAEELGQISLMAADLVQYLPRAILQHQRGKQR